MDNSENDTIPKVFISYSHDSPSHKKWVGEISSKLVENGIDVILDQWDLGLGDDVPKFMENSVSVADRVLMICSEKYVKKADEGKGGVGYEAMIVTGELIRNLGTSKFIPIVRQKVAQSILPKSVSTRFYINFSEGANFKEQFEILLRELHQVPAEKKPPLGKNPFALKPSGKETPSNISVSTVLNDIAEEILDPRTSYKNSLDVARKGDLVIWRKMVRNAVKPIPQKLNEWRGKYERSSPTDLESLQNIALEGADIFAIIFSIALSGVESGREKFINQVGLLDEILNPRNWNLSGLTRIVNFPDTIACIYQALHGAMCLQTNQISLCSQFARTKITKRSEDKSLPLYKRHEIIGWPEALGRKTTDTWKFLTALPEKWVWLEELFGSEAEFRESLCAYYLILNIIEFVDTIAEGNEEILQQREVMLYVPLCFLHEDYETLQRAYRLVLVEAIQLRDVWKSKNVPENKLKEFWPKWVHHLTYWLSRVYDFGFRTTVIHKNLFDDIG